MLMRTTMDSDPYTIISHPCTIALIHLSFGEHKFSEGDYNSMNCNFLILIDFCCSLLNRVVMMRNLNLSIQWMEGHLKKNSKLIQLFTLFLSLFLFKTNIEFFAKQCQTTCSTERKTFQEACSGRKFSCGCPSFT